MQIASKLWPWILVMAACSSSVNEQDVVEYLKVQPSTVRDQLIAKSDARPERTDVIRRGSGPLTLVGQTLDVGDAMPAVAVAGPKLEKIDLGALVGKVVVLSVVPSIDTRVCETQTHKVNDSLALFPPNAAVFTISRDLPFAQTRFAEDAVIRTGMGSDYHGGSFGKAFGIEVKETGLLARSVWVIAPDGKIVYREIVADQGTEPDYDALIAAAKRASGA